MQFQFDSIAALMAMNGHGPYVWAAYAITLVCLVALVWVPVAQKRRFIRAHRLQQARERQQQAQQAL